MAGANELSFICKWLHDTEVWPQQWQGGRQNALYKGPGDSADPNRSRGLLLANHMAKIPTSILKWEIDESYQRCIPRSQHGAVRGRSTDMAHHLLLTALDASKLLEVSSAAASWTWRRLSTRRSERQWWAFRRIYTPPARNKFHTFCSAVFKPLLSIPSCPCWIVARL